MARLVWNQSGKRIYETGIDRVVLYTLSRNASYSSGVSWNGVTSLEENISGTDITPIYADNMKYLNLYSLGDFGITLGAYSYPDEFIECDGSKYVAKGVIITSQHRRSFGLCYRTLVGNDIMFNKYGYKLHFVYGAKASPSEKSHGTTTDSPEPENYSWDITTTPVAVRNHEPTAHVVIDCTKFKGKNLLVLEDIIYGTNDADARLPSIEELIGIVSGNDVISDNKLNSLLDSGGEVIFSSF